MTEDMTEDQAYVHLQFPCGTTFLIRTDTSGVVFDDKWRPVDEELAFDMLLIKGRKLYQRQVAGHA